VEERAREYLALMIANGMIKPEAVPATLRSQLPPAKKIPMKPAAKQLQAGECASRLGRHGGPPDRP